MKLTYKFSALSFESGRQVTGLVDAETDVFALSKIKKMGFKQPTVTLDLWASAKHGFGLLAGGGFDLREKARLFETVGRRLQRDGSLITALENSREYIQDGRLMSAAAVAAAVLSDGHKPHEAMEGAGFDKRDCMVIRALNESGNMYKAFLDLAAEARAKQQTDSAISSAMFMPRIVFVSLYLMLPGFFGFVGPQMARFFKRANNLAVPPGVKWVYDLVDWVSANPALGIAAWIGLGVAGVMVRQAPAWKQLLGKVKTFRDLAIKSEHSQLWSVYSLMYGAGIPPQEICEVVRPAVVLQDTSESLRIFQRRLAAGDEEKTAIEAARFPRFVVAGYRSAKDSGSMQEGLHSFSQMLKEDVELLTSAAKRWLDIASVMLLVGLILVVFLLFYYPIASPLLRSF